MHFRALLVYPVAIAIALHSSDAKGQDGGSSDVKRVTVSQNNDGSRTTYEVDNEAHKAVATTISPNGKVQSRIRYELDEAGRFATGEVYGPAEQFRFKTIYKYDSAGRLESETQLTKEGAVKNKLVYAYDQLSGRQTGYAIYDGAGKLLGRTNTSGNAATAPHR